MATSPSYIGSAGYTNDRASLSSANTAIDGTGAITALATGTANGKRILEITTQCSATSAAALVNIFYSSDSGSTWTLFDQITITAASSSTTAKCNRNSAGYDNLVLTGTTQRLGCTTTIAQATCVYALGGDLT
jgi:hypothetical protein